MTTVTQGKWNVGSCHSSARPGVYVFQPFRVVHESPWKSAHGDWYGREFSSSEEVSAFALSHGYTRQYFGPYAVGRRVHRGALAGIAETFRTMLHHCHAWDDVRVLVRSCASEVTAAFGGDVLAGLHWEVGYWDAARKLRSDLFPLRDLPAVGSRVRVCRAIQLPDGVVPVGTLGTVRWVAASKWLSGPVMHVALPSGLVAVDRDSFDARDGEARLDCFSPVREG